MFRLSTDWQKAGRSGNNNGCVEARLRTTSTPGSGLIEIRNSNAPEAGSVVFTRHEWQTFLDAVTEDGDFQL